MDNKKLEFKLLKGKEISDELFNEFYNYLIESMRKDEYRSYEKQKSLLEKEHYQILFCFFENRIIGVMALWRLSSFEFIEHFAVKKECRGKGIGSKMIEFIQNKFNNKVILEVELPYNETNRKRIYFYEQHGFSYNDFEYFQTPLNQGDEPLPLRIMSYPDPISRKEFEKAQNLLKESAYKH